MKTDSSNRHTGTGTRFRLFPQAPYLTQGVEPETVWISTLAGETKPGPADARAYVVDPVNKPLPYGDRFMPPFRGPVHYPALPDAEGHFDYLPVDSREFRAAHMFAAVRFTLDVWEGYFGRPIGWHFSSHYERLELVTVVDWDNAHSGFGFIEAGYGLTEGGHGKLYSLNFDVMAHEVGHSIIFAEVGTPPTGTPWTDEYRSFHESASDLIALLSALHLDSVLHRLLDSTKGNLYRYNELGRFGELSNTEQIRLACNDVKMSDLHGLGDHGRSLPLTGAVFDFLVEMFQTNLVEQRLLRPEVASLSHDVRCSLSAENFIQAEFAGAFLDHPVEFRQALERARDHVGLFLVRTWQQLSPGQLDHRMIAAAMLEAEDAMGGRYLSMLAECLQWRNLLPDGGVALHNRDLPVPTLVNSSRHQ